MLSPSEITGRYSQIGAEKASQPAWKMLLLGISAGFLIGMGAAVANTASHSITNVSAARIISGLLFPFGLAIVMLLGAELFTGDCMIVISVLEKRTSIVRLLKNWMVVYIGNFIGASALAAGCAFFGQLDYSDDGLAAYTIKVAATKCALPFDNAFVLGILCNLLVCMGVLCAISAKDTGGKIARSLHTGCVLRDLRLRALRSEHVLHIGRTVCQDQSGLRSQGCRDGRPYRLAGLGKLPVSKPGAGHVRQYRRRHGSRAVDVGVLPTAE